MTDTIVRARDAGRPVPRHAGARAARRAAFVAIAAFGGIAGIAGIGCSRGESGGADSAAAAAGASATLPDSAGDDAPVGIKEGYPARVIAAMDERARQIAARATARPGAVEAKGAQQVIRISRTWDPGETLTVAFHGGSDQVRQAIVEAALEWGRASGLTLDFWTDAARARFREWQPGDLAYAAHVRIGFDGGREGGYWSAVGAESIDPALHPAGRPSLNLEGFDRQLPFDWRATTLHEFGHVLGFEHEHQHPAGTCTAEFRWDDEPGYVPTRDADGRFLPDAAGRRPGLRSVFSGYPNEWSVEEIDFNLRRLPFADSLRASAFDPASIMKYYFEPALLRRGRASPCFSPRSTRLSARDMATAHALYAGGPQGIGTPGASEPALAAALRRSLDSAGVGARIRAALERDFRAIRNAQAKVSATIPE